MSSSAEGTQLQPMSPVPTGRALVKSKRHVIVTRPEADAPNLVKAIEAAGMCAVSSPLMTIARNDHDVDLTGAAALAFTSANGVRAFIEKSSVRHIPTFAVGKATASAAKSAGFDRVYVAGGDVSTLANLIAELYGVETKIGTVVHLAGTRRAGDLVFELESLSIPAARAVIYDATPVGTLSGRALDIIDAADTLDKPPMVALFSPRTARLFVDALRAEGRFDRISELTAACLSDAVAQQAKAAVGSQHWRGYLVAEEPDASSLIDAMKR
ncbi:MAG: uroporphyrinogen-III synthase [Pseudomonadota bacterium]